MLAGLWISTQSNKNRCIAPNTTRLLTIHPIIRYLFPPHDNQIIPMNTQPLLGKESQSNSIHSKRHSKEQSTTDHQSTEIIVPQQSPEKRDSNQKPKSRSRQPPKDHNGTLKEVVDAIQRLAFIGLGIWAFVRTNNYIELASIVAIGQIDACAAKDLIARIIKAIFTEV